MLVCAPAGAQQPEDGAAPAQGEAPAPPVAPAPSFTPGAPAQTAPSPTSPSQTTPAPVAPPAAGPLRQARPAVPRSPILIVNRQAVLENSAAARALQETERETLERVTAELERVKTELQVEEQELTRLKPTLPPEQFDARAREFDRKVKAERAAGQERRALFQKFTQEARQALASALPRVLEALRRETGALVLLDASALAAADPSLDVTALAIERYDAEMGDVRFDPPGELMPR
ncbi:OmpH family outer membrane protein [Albimonas sp. CAU 1670]|uniref:OmpH family outer membrane protein n=1 Tax=Albimonas sp. CAU 1670 TaxID=3032599 RepID=UPI0023DA7844|nr:OmpH family outer membrane protein [Albimonas sp. CAU 1670]MDF2231650.1 OmpH family outer membrane protein [Albimonas sp. CAU 1670]